MIGGGPGRTGQHGPGGLAVAARVAQPSSGRQYASQGSHGFCLQRRRRAACGVRRAARSRCVRNATSFASPPCSPLRPLGWGSASGVGGGDAVWGACTRGPGWAEVRRHAGLGREKVRAGWAEAHPGPRPIRVPGGDTDGSHPAVEAHGRCGPRQ